MEPEATWRWRCDVRPDRTIVALTGEIDMMTASHLRDLLYKRIAESRRVEVDLARVTFIDSSVINTLVTAYQHTADHRVRFTLANPSGHVRRVLALTGVLPTLGDPAASSAP